MVSCIQQPTQRDRQSTKYCQNILKHKNILGCTGVWNTGNNWKSKKKTRAATLANLFDQLLDQVSSSTKNNTSCTSAHCFGWIDRR